MNVQVGDIVLLQDSGMIKGKWKLGKVVRADQSMRDGYVRTVGIQYKNAESTSFITISRPVQRIVVILPMEAEEEYSTQC